MNIELAIKFGSHEIIVYRKGQGIIAKEPAYLAVTPNGKSFRVKAVGKNAEKLRSTKSKSILVHEPIKNSAVVDEKLATILIRSILQKSIFDIFTLQKVSALVALPCALPIEDILKLKKCLLSAGINKVNFVTNGVSVREYYDKIDDYANVLVVDIGKYTLDLTVLNKFAISAGRDYTIGGLDMDVALQTYIADNYNVEVTLSTAEQIKNKVASLYPHDYYSTEFLGISEDKTFRKLSISANEVRIAITGIYDRIIDLIKNYIKELPKELGAEIFKNGIILSGGGANIQGLYEYMSKSLDFPIIALDNPVDAVVLGCAKLIEKPLSSVLKIEI